MVKIERPVGRPLEPPSFEERVAQFREDFGFAPEREPEISPHELIEFDAGLGTKSMLESYWKRHPEARPRKPIVKTLTLTEIGPVIAPDGTRAGKILEGIVKDMTRIAEGQTRLVNELNRIESELEKQNPCEAERGKGWKLVDGECVELSPSYVQETSPADSPQKSVVEKRSFIKASSSCGNLKCKANGKPHVHEHIGG